MSRASGEPPGSEACFASSSARVMAPRGPSAAGSGKVTGSDPPDAQAALSRSGRTSRSGAVRRTRFSVNCPREGSGRARGARWPGEEQESDSAASPGRMPRAASGIPSGPSRCRCRTPADRPAAPHRTPTRRSRVHPGSRSAGGDSQGIPPQPQGETSRMLPHSRPAGTNCVTVWAPSGCAR